MELLLAHFNKRRGFRAQLARDLGISRAALHRWRQVPARHVLVVEQLTGISRHQLRPDIFGERE
jgi:DNA-binding transcriptional regulator YdaS (Cro superfamily)